MVRCVYCVNLYKNNCPYWYKVQYNNPYSSKLETICCDVWCFHELYFWHYFSWRPVTKNDFNVFAGSQLMREIQEGLYNFKNSKCYSIRNAGRLWHLYYFILDGLYPSWPIFSKPMHQASNRAQVKYSERQESVRKYVERLFGVLQSRFEIISQELGCSDTEDIVLILNTHSPKHHDCAGAAKRVLQGRGRLDGYSIWNIRTFFF